MLPNDNKVTSWTDFKARQAARETAEDLGGQIAKSIETAKPEAARKRAPSRARVIAEATLAETLRAAVRIAVTRRRPASEELIREQVLLDVLCDAMRRAQ